MKIIGIEHLSEQDRDRLEAILREIYGNEGHPLHADLVNLLDERSELHFSSLLEEGSLVQFIAEHEHGIQLPLLDKGVAQGGVEPFDMMNGGDYAAYYEHLEEGEGALKDGLPQKGAVSEGAEPVETASPDQAFGGGGLFEAIQDVTGDPSLEGELEAAGGHAPQREESPSVNEPTGDISLEQAFGGSGGGLFEVIQNVTGDPSLEGELEAAGGHAPQREDSPSANEPTGGISLEQAFGDNSAPVEAGQVPESISSEQAFGGSVEGLFGAIQGAVDDSAEAMEFAGGMAHDRESSSDLGGQSAQDSADIPQGGPKDTEGSYFANKSKETLADDLSERRRKELDDLEHAAQVSELQRRIGGGVGGEAYGAAPANTGLAEKASRFAGAALGLGEEALNAVTGTMKAAVERFRARKNELVGPSVREGEKLSSQKDAASAIQWGVSESKVANDLFSRAAGNDITYNQDLHESISAQTEGEVIESVGRAEMAIQRADVQSLQSTDEYLNENSLATYIPKGAAQSVGSLLQNYESANDSVRDQLKREADILYNATFDNYMVFRDNLVKRSIKTTERMAECVEMGQLDPRVLQEDVLPFVENALRHEKELDSQLGLLKEVAGQDKDSMESPRSKRETTQHLEELAKRISELVERLLGNNKLGRDRELVLERER